MQCRSSSCRWRETWAALLIATATGACSEAPPPVAGHAPRLLYLSTLSAGEDAEDLASLRRELARATPRTGEVELVARNLSSAASSDAALAAAVRHELGSARWDLVFTPTMRVAALVQQSDDQMPLVFDGAANPTQLCLVRTLNAPGRNATGYTSFMPSEAKLIEALVDAYPATREVLALVDGGQPPPAPCVAPGGAAAAPPVITAEPPCTAGEVPASAELPYLDLRALRQAAQARQIGLRIVRLCDAADLERLPQFASRARGSGILVPMHFLFYVESRRLVQVINAMRVPAIYARHFFVQYGGLMSLAPTTQQGEPRAHELVVRVLAGEAPSRLAVQTPEGFELRINVASARELGLPPSLLALRRAHSLAP
jgi:ABC-type uncharacterized transport system substrate-binding protein